MALFKRGKIWWIDIQRNGKRVRISTKTSDKHEAQTIYAQLLLKLNSGDNQLFKEEAEHKEVPRFGEFFREYYLKWCYKRQSYYEVKKYLVNALPKWFKDLTINEISTRQLELLQNYFIEKKLSVATCNRYLAMIKASFTKAHEWGMIKEEQLKAIRLVKPLKGEKSRLRFLSKEEIQALLSNCDGYLYPIVLVALNTGMRKSEILNLKWSQIDLKHGFIYLDETTKNRQGRQIPLNETLKSLFRQLFTERNLSTDYVFVNPATGKRYTELKRSFATACKKSGIRDFKFHDLRHTFASQLVMSGVDLKTVQELLGHKTLTMTLRYSHLSQAHKMEAVKALDNIHVTKMSQKMSQSG